MKLAICTWNDLVAPLFDVSTQIMVVRITSGKIRVLHYENLVGMDNPGKISRLCSGKIEVLICGAISRLWYEFILVRGIDIIACISGKVGDVLSGLRKGRLNLEKHCMPGCPQRFYAYNQKTNTKLAETIHKKS